MLMIGGCGYQMPRMVFLCQINIWNYWYFAIASDCTNTTAGLLFCFKSIWKCAVPSKVIAFAWQSCLDRIPTKMNLCRRGILRAEEVVCPVCGAMGESTTHLFFHCNLDIVAIVPLDVIMSYGHMVISGRNKRIRKGYAIVWLALIWVLWRMRNDRVCNNNIGTMADAMDQIQRLS
jgi:hypothetical protein